MSKETRSGASICFEKMEAAEEGQVVTIKWLRKNNTQHMTTSSAANVIHKSQTAGALDAAEGGGYLINKAKLAKYLANRRPHSAFYRKRVVQPNQKRKNKALPLAILAHPDIDIINNLLDAMAAAEPILAKYKGICSAVNNN